MKGLGLLGTLVREQFLSKHVKTQSVGSARLSHQTMNRGRDRTITGSGTELAGSGTELEASSHRLAFSNLGHFGVSPGLSLHSAHHPRRSSSGSETLLTMPQEPNKN